MKYGVIGYPIEHSLSPAMFGAVFEREGLGHEYAKYKVAPDELSDFLKGSVSAGDLGGFSVTIPHKEAVVAMMDELNNDAEIIGAVNTIAIRNKRLFGYNTDWIGVMRALSEITVLKGREVTVLGAGGAAAAVIYACLQAGARLTVLNRDVSRADALKQRFNADFETGPLNMIEQIETEILIQTTPVGMAPNEGDSLVSGKYLRSGMTVMDIVYNPQMTKLLCDAKDAGCKIVFGYKMLLFQGAEQYKIWFGKEPNINVMETALLKYLK